MTKEERSTINRANRAKGRLNPYRQHPLRDIWKFFFGTQYGPYAKHAHASAGFYEPWFDLATFCDDVDRLAGARPSRFHRLRSSKGSLSLGPPVFWEVAHPSELPLTMREAARELYEAQQRERSEVWRAEQLAAAFGTHPECLCPNDVAAACPCAWAAAQRVIRLLAEEGQGDRSPDEGRCREWVG